MRHRLGYKKLNRTSEHRKALIKNMLNSLIKYEQITTTLPKAKVLKPQADKVITLGKKDTLQNTKTLISILQDKNSANKVKKKLSTRYEKRNGGYTRIIKSGFRYGDNAPMAVIEFVDRDTLAKKFRILVAGGFGNLKGKVFRVGCMGEVDRYHVMRCISGIASTLSMMGYDTDTQAGLKVAEEKLKPLESL